MSLTTCLPLTWDAFENARHQLRHIVDELAFTNIQGADAAFTAAKALIKQDLADLGEAFPELTYLPATKAAVLSDRIGIEDPNYAFTRANEITGELWDTFKPVYYRLSAKAGWASRSRDANLDLLQSVELEKRLEFLELVDARPSPEFWIQLLRDRYKPPRKEG